MVLREIMGKATSSVVLHPYLLTTFLLLFLYKENIHQLSFFEMFFPLVVSLGGVALSHELFSLLLRGQHTSGISTSGIFTSLLALFFFNFGRIMDARDSPPHVPPLLWKVVLLVLLLGILLLGFIVFKKWRRSFPHTRAGIITFSLLLFSFVGIIIFFNTKIISFVQQFHPLQVIYFVTDHPLLLLSLVFFFFFALLYLFRKSSHDFSEVSTYANFFSFVLLALVLFQIGTYHFTEREVLAGEQTTFFSSFNLTSEKDENQPRRNAELPDIYYIVLDGYAGEKTLSRAYAFDNSPFLQELEKREFYIASESRSNYLLTFLSLASSLNMDYLDFLKETPGKWSKDRSIPYQLIDQNRVVLFLKNQGYRYYHFSSGWAATEDNPLADKVFDPFKTSELGFVLLRSTPLRLLTANDHAVTVLYAFEKLKELSSLPGPKFVFAHIEVPHPPYTFNERGDIVSQEPYDPSGKQWIDKKGYLGQVQFANGKTLEVVDAILQHSKTPPLIILQGDHGTDTVLNWVKAPTQERLEERSYILNAYLLPGESKKFLFPHMSPVNTFRFIFKEYFQQQLSLLQDKTYFSDHYQTPYNFTLVYEDSSYVGPFPQEDQQLRLREMPFLRESFYIKSTEARGENRESR